MIDYTTAYSIIASIKKMTSNLVDMQSLYNKDVDLHEISFTHYQNLILSKFVLINKNHFFDDLGQLCLIFNEYGIQFEIVDLQLSFEQQTIFNEYCYISWNQLFHQLKTYNKVESDVIEKLKKYFIIYPDRLLKAEVDIRIKALKLRIQALKDKIDKCKMKSDTENELKYANVLIKSNNKLKRLEQMTPSILYDVFL